jgi:hypothetical protein
VAHEAKVISKKDDYRAQVAGELSRFLLPIF